MSGVTRRRQAGGTSTNENGDLPARTTTPARVNGHRDLEQESDHKIAYDPKDLEQGEERAKQPKLTLMEEVLLLGLKDREVRMH
jgi:Golgi phosphoprotein 3